MRSGGTLTVIGACALLAGCGEAVPIDRAARQAEDDRRAAARSIEDAAATKVRDDRQEAYARERNEAAGQATEAVDAEAPSNTPVPPE